VHEELSLLKKASLFWFRCAVVACSYFSVRFVIFVNYWYQVRAHAHFHCYICGAGTSFSPCRVLSRRGVNDSFHVSVLFGNIWSVFIKLWRNWLMLECYWLLVYALWAVAKRNCCPRFESRIEARPSYSYFKWPRLCHFRNLFSSLMLVTYFAVAPPPVFLLFVGFLLLRVLNTPMLSLQSKE
jgi:hypothetical protein